MAEQSCFALKGGTAINLFVRNLPRLSVDIDLVYLPMKDRDEALAEIKLALDEISKAFQEKLAGTEVIASYKEKNDALRLVVKRNGVQIKIELSPVLRGTVFEPKVLAVSEAVEEEFGYAEMLVVDLADLYAGKICAALDRQHPRDLYDVKLLLENEGFTDEIKKALLVYLISHNRPIAELLNPQLKELDSIYAGEFANMAEQPVALGELLATRLVLIELVNKKLTSEDKEFLLSFKKKQPKWELLGLSNVSQLPAVKWKQQNLANMSEDKHNVAYQKLEKHLLRY